MIENHELDDFVTNTDLSNKLRNTKTSEEVLELLKNYNYHESKEVFEVELMDLLKEFVGEEELLKVSGGKINKQSFSNIVTSLAVAGSLCMPVQGVTGVQQKEKREDKKSSYSVGLPPKEKAGLTVCGIVGVGVLLEEVLRRTIFTRKDGNIENNDKEKKGQVCSDIKPELYKEMHDHFMKIATSPEKCTPEDFKKYTLRELGDYMFEELLKWFQYMEKYHQVDGNKNYVTKEKCDGEDEYAQSFVATWNDNLPKLVCIHLAGISVTARLNEFEDETLQHYLTCIRQTENITDEPKTWEINKHRLTQLGVNEKAAEELEIMIEQDSYAMTNVMNQAVLAYVIDWEANSDGHQLKKVKEEKLLNAEKQLNHMTNYLKSEEYKKFRGGLTITP